MRDNRFSCPAAGLCSSAVRAGTSRAATDSSSISPMIRAVPAAKVSRPRRRPPTRNASPSTSSTFARMDPTMADCTTPTSPARRAKRETNSSGRLPSALCTIPVSEGPSRSPSASTPRPTTRASSASAIALSTNTTVPARPAVRRAKVTTTAATDPPRSR